MTDFAEQGKVAKAVTQKAAQTVSVRFTLALLEQFIGDGAVLLHLRNMGFDPGDFLPERVDPFLEFGDRQRVQILPDQLDQRIARPGGKKVVQIHRKPALTHGAAKSISLPLRIGAPERARAPDRARAWGGEV